MSELRSCLHIQRESLVVMNTILRQEQNHQGQDATCRHHFNVRIVEAARNAARTRVTSTKGAVRPHTLRLDDASDQFDKQVVAIRAKGQKRAPRGGQSTGWATSGKAITDEVFYLGTFRWNTRDITILENRIGQAGCTYSHTGVSVNARRHPGEFSGALLRDLREGIWGFLSKANDSCIGNNGGDDA